VIIPFWVGGGLGIYQMEVGVWSRIWAIRMSLRHIGADLIGSLGVSPSKRSGRWLIEVMLVIR
jgi:hypothetical protein